MPASRRRVLEIPAYISLPPNVVYSRREGNFIELPARDGAPPQHAPRRGSPDIHHHPRLRRPAPPLPPPRYREERNRAAGHGAHRHVHFASNPFGYDGGHRRNDDFDYPGPYEDEHPLPPFPPGFPDFPNYEEFSDFPGSPDFRDLEGFLDFADFLGIPDVPPGFELRMYGPRPPFGVLVMVVDVGPEKEDGEDVEVRSAKGGLVNVDDDVRIMKFVKRDCMEHDWECTENPGRG